MRKTEEAVDDSVLLSGHSPKLDFECIERFPECHEHQTFSARIRPWHGAANNEGLAIEAFLRRPFDVCRNRRVIEFLVVAQTPSDDVVALGLGHCLEMLQVMYPLLGRDEARTIEPGSRSFDYRRIDCRISFGIFGAVLVTRQIEPSIVLEAVDSPLTAKCWSKHARNRVSRMSNRSAVAVSNPEPDIGLCRWDLATGPAQVRERTKSLDRLSQPLNQTWTDADD